MGPDTRYSYFLLFLLPLFPFENVTHFHGQDVSTYADAGKLK